MKRILILIAIIILIAVGIYAYKVYTGKVPSLTEVASTAHISAANLIAAFEKDSAAANRHYLGKIITVSGMIKSVENKPSVVVLGNLGSLSSVRCTMDTAFVKEMASLNSGQPVNIKGHCTGYRADDLGLGADVVLNRCVLETGNPK